MNLTTLVFVVLALACALPGCRASTNSSALLKWNPSTDWGTFGSVTEHVLRNPNGEWTYKEADESGSVQYHFIETVVPWPGFFAVTRNCVIGKNLGTTAVYVPVDRGGGWVGPGQVAFDAGEKGHGKTAVLSWRATCSARVRVRAVFTGNHIPVDDKDPGTKSRVSVRHGAQRLWDAEINGFIGCASPRLHAAKGAASRQAYSGSLSVQPGDTISFECDFSETPQGPCRGLTGLEADIVVLNLEPDAGGGVPEGWQDALKPKGAIGEEITLAVDGRPLGAIVLPRRPDAKEQKAAADLQRWLYQMTGAKLPIRRESAASGRLGEIFVSIGNTQLLKHLGLPLASSDLGVDGYAIIQSGRSLFLRGGSRRGPINAVYALLEEDLGCRWYDRYSAHIPFRPTLRFRPATRSYVPQLDIRDPFVWYAFEPNWSLRNRTNAPWVPIREDWGGTTDYALFVHSLNWLMNPDTYFKDHPDYYAERGGKRIPDQPCLTNPAVLPIVINSTKETLRKSPRSEIISISYMDNAEYCECRSCKASDEQYGPSGTLLNFANLVADAIKDEFPDVKVSALAYWGTFDAPKQVKPRDNVVIQLCTDRHSFRHPFSYVTDTTEFQTAMRGWAAVGARTYIWDYVTNFSDYSLPMPNMQVCDRNYEFFLKLGASGIMTQGAYQSPGGENGPMRSWVWAKKLWDPSLWTIDLMRDFVFGYYREAAQPIWDYNMLLWDMWEKSRAMPDEKNPLSTGIWFQPDAAFLSRDFLSQAMEMMRRAESLAGSPETRRRVALAKYPVLYTTLCRELGFVGGDGVFRPGASLFAADKTHLRAMTEEFEDITHREGVTRLKEARADVAERFARWKSILDVDMSGFRSTGLSNNWKFKTDPDDTGVAKKWFDESADDSAWAEVRSDKGYGWEKQGFPDYVGVGWYRQVFLVPDELKDAKHVYLFFQGVDEEGWIYVNGRQVYERSSQSTGQPPVDLWDKPFFFDAKPFLAFGKDNLLSVRVKNHASMGGVWRPVFLVGSDSAVTDVHVLSLACGKSL